MLSLSLQMFIIARSINQLTNHLNCSCFPLPKRSLRLKTLSLTHSVVAEKKVTALVLLTLPNTLSSLHTTLHLHNYYTA